MLILQEFLPRYNVRSPMTFGNIFCTKLNNALRTRIRFENQESLRDYDVRKMKNAEIENRKRERSANKQAQIALGSINIPSSLLRDLAETPTTARAKFVRRDSSRQENRTYPLGPRACRAARTIGLNSKRPRKYRSLVNAAVLSVATAIVYRTDGRHTLTDCNVSSAEKDLKSEKKKLRNPNKKFFGHDENER